MFTGIINKLNEWSEALKQFMLNHQDHAVILYTVLFCLGLAVFAAVYSALHKNN